MLIDRMHSTLLIVDVQTRLLPAIADGDAVLENCRWLARVARRLEIPTVISEQYPAGLGATDERLARDAAGARLVEKTHFSCVAERCLDGTAVDERRQVVVVGTEAHVCVLQTVLDLRGQGKEVFVVADAVGSRLASNRDLALARMRAHGIDVVSREMVAFEWLQKSATDEFRAINRDFIRDG